MDKRLWNLLSEQLAGAVKSDQEMARLWRAWACASLDTWIGDAHHKEGTVEEYMAHCGWKSSRNAMDEAVKLARKSGCYEMITIKTADEEGKTQNGGFHWLRIDSEGRGILHELRAVGGRVEEEGRAKIEELKARENRGKDIPYGQRDVQELLELVDTARLIRELEGGAPTETPPDASRAAEGRSYLRTVA